MNRFSALFPAAIAGILVTISAHPARAAGISDTWQPTDNWLLEAKLADNTPFKVRVTLGTQTTDGANAQYLRFFPLEGPDNLKRKGFRVYLKKEDPGCVVRALAEEGESPILVENAGEDSGYITGAPEGLPLEWFNANVLPVGKRPIAGSKRMLEIRKEEKGDMYVLQIILSEDDVETLRVKQEWAVGEKWWRSYERRVNGEVDLTAKRLAEGTAPSPGSRGSGTVAQRPSGSQAPSQVNRPVHPGRGNASGPDPARAIYSDSRLDVNVRLVAKHPKIEEVLPTLAKATDLKLSVHPSLADNQPDFGEMALTSTRVSNVMGYIAGKYPKGAYWEKTDDGYTLTSPDLAKGSAGADGDPEEKHSSNRWILWTAIGLMLLGTVSVAFAILRKRRSPVAAPRSAPSARPAAKGAAPVKVKAAAGR